MKNSIISCIEQPLFLNYHFLDNKSFILIKDTSKHFKFAPLFANFEQDEAAMEEYLELVMANFTHIKDDILTAIQKSDSIFYAASYRKTHNTLNLLKATQLQNLLAKGKMQILMDSSQPTDAVFVDLEEAFSGFLLDLKKLLTDN